MVLCNVGGVKCQSFFFFFFFNLETIENSTENYFQENVRFSL